MIIVANFKANKNNGEVVDWIKRFHQQQFLLAEKNQIKVVICPSFVALESAYKTVKSLDWQMEVLLGVQNVSVFEGGAYTGEVTIGMIKEYARYAIVGHSERRRYFLEDNKTVLKKIAILKAAEVIPIVCVSGIEETEGLEDFDGFIAYEPLESIGSGRAVSVENLTIFVNQVRKLFKKSSILYGGSVTELNIGSFTKNSFLEGVLVGTASLDPVLFARLIANA